MIIINTCEYVSKFVKICLASYLPNVILLQRKMCKIFIIQDFYIRRI